jgi:hypothetical protein
MNNLMEVTKMTRLTIISFIIVILMFAGPGYAKIDIKTVVGVWLFDEGGGDLAQDSSINGNDGTLNGPEWTNMSKFGGALEFNGTDAYIEFATGESMKTPHLTFMAWFNTRKLDGYGHIFQTGNDWDDMAGYVFRVHQDGHAQAALAFAPGNTATWLSGPAIEADTWYHMVLTYDGTDAILYLDGENVASGAGQGEIMYDNQPVRIGVLSQTIGSAFDGFIDEVALFNVALEAEDIEAIMNNGLARTVGSQPFASRPSPVDGAMNAGTWATLTWQPGDLAVSHDVYMGDNFNDVFNGTDDTFQGNYTDDFIMVGFFGYPFPDGLVNGTTYYWRIDEVNDTDPNSPWKGDVWSFSIPPMTAYNPGPADGAEFVGLNIRLTWTAGYGAILSYIVFGEDFDEVSSAAAGVSSGPVSYNPGPLKLAKTYYWRVDAFDGIETHKGEVWSFTTLGAVSGPNPTDNAVGVNPSVVLSWGAGAVAASHEVYFGTDADAVKNATTTSPEYKGPKALGEENYDPGKLTLNTTYYWRIDEVNGVNPDSPWAGNVWSFTTSDFFVIDDFEGYDSGENQIWFSWHDGLGYGTPGTADYFAGNGTGAAVGDESAASYTEETIVHGGLQSMPIAYDNNKQGYSKYSEVELTLSAIRDWTAEDIAELSLWFRGNPASVGSFVEGPAGTYTMTGSGADIWAVDGVEADEFHYAFKTLTGTGSIVARVESISNTDVWAKAGVMVRETLDPDSAHAMMVVTPGSGISFQRRPGTGATSVDDTTSGITTPYWVKIERDLSGNFSAYSSADGSAWQKQGVSQTIQMASNVYIGLAVTAHNASATCEVVFTNVTTTGNVSGQWANQDIGIFSNDAEPLYVAVSGTAGNPAVVVHDDANAAQIDTWTEWVIPLQTFADQGIVLTNVDRIAIGLGRRGNMTILGGSGKMFIDDIRLYQQREAAE